MVNLAHYQRQQQKVIDEQLDAALKPSQELHPELHAAMRYAVFSGGKRIRPLLVVAAAEALGGQAVAALPAAVAVELLHTYTLIHDDLPAMDDDDLRRGKPTVHVTFGEANAILAGDALQALAFATLADHPQAADLIRELGAAGVGVVAGQWADLMVTSDTATPASIEFIHAHKTADVLRACVRMGGIVGGATEPQLVALTAYGEAIGHLFQLTDDLLDAGTEDKPTAISVWDMAGTQEQAEHYHTKAHNSLVDIPEPEILAAIATLIFERTA